MLNFITFKPLVKKVCDELDHRTLIQSDNPILKVRQDRRSVQVLYKDQRLILPRRDVILLPLVNTSTELLAEYIARKIRRRTLQKFPGAKLHFIEVSIDETIGQRGVFRGEF